MRSIWTIFVLTIFVQSCKVEQWCNDRYPPQVKDSLWTKTDTIIKWDTVKVPEITVEFDTTFDFVPHGVDFHHEEKKSGLTSSLSIKNGRIKTLCRADSLELVIKNLKESQVTFNQKKETKWLPCEKEHKTGFNTFATYWFWITLLLILIAVIIKCFRG